MERRHITITMTDPEFDAWSKAARKAGRTLHAHFMMTAASSLEFENAEVVIENTEGGTVAKMVITEETKTPAKKVASKKGKPSGSNLDGNAKEGETDDDKK